MNFLTNFTIRRVVQCILVAAFIIVALAGLYGSEILRDLHKQTQREGKLVAQLIFLTRAGNTMKSGDDSIKRTLAEEVPATPDWDEFRTALTGSDINFNSASKERLEFLEERLADKENAFNDDRQKLELAFTVASLFIFMLLVFCDRFLVVHLVEPLTTLREHFRGIASGELTNPLQDLGRNCVGQLVPLVKAMQDSLLLTVLSIRNNTDLLKREAADIEAGNTDLSVRTTQQATSLEQTAHSITQLSANVQQNALSADEASSLAEKTAYITGEGEKLVNSVGLMMNGITEEAEKIRQFTATVNSIAFQTNILALNAAVEAARAGEQGRGFAVVATEVRTLAQRSASAAKEIEGLINTTLARVNEGKEVADRAGHTMRTVTQCVSSVDELIRKISYASNEQSKGIIQVTQAVTDIERVTQQNSTLVRHVASSAVRLNTRTEDMAKTIIHFALPATTQV
ncbi:methyl-accepting chemotaxis protein [Pantoea sp. Taur]|uniref:methyl-accepting chemotaxis protein n=1 Tax=Pantoea sp. Taur TaxID=2576757 RepID=UPI001352F8A9|nr:methyl-accepting chemotaxis protein [Pantoea sp. Taur]MXP57595.1 transcription factor [Pantoea sp. Taur]